MPAVAGYRTDPAALATTARGITSDDGLAVEAGLDVIPPDEIIAEPNLADYLAPSYLSKTAPHLAGPFEDLLERLQDLNARFTGDRTVETQAYLSLTGEHEDLEEQFFAWCRQYFAVRGDPERLNPQLGNDPWQQYRTSYEEFDRLLGRRLVAPNTINSCVLNLSERYMCFGFASRVLGPDVEALARTGRDRFGSDLNRAQARNVVTTFRFGVQQFATFLADLSANLPAEYQVHPDSNWVAEVEQRIRGRAADVDYLRPILCSASRVEATTRQLTPNLWGRIRWDVYHGRSVAAVLTSSAHDTFTHTGTEHPIAVRRDGWLCHREFSWIRVDPEHLPAERAHELAVNWYLLDTFTDTLLAAWDKLDREARDALVTQGCEPNATEAAQTAALTVELAEPAIAADDEARPRQRLQELPLKRLELLLTKHFHCKCRDGKGSE
jgi:hypothetical protein